MRKKQSRDPIASFERESKAARRVGQGRKCKCGEDTPLALVSGSNPAICAACKREKLSQSPFDQHHPAGRANHPAKIPIWVNDHRSRLSDAQYDWPKLTWENLLGSPALSAACSIRGYYDSNSYLNEQLLLWVAEFLEVLDRAMTNQLGPQWWAGTELERFAPRRKPKT